MDIVSASVKLLADKFCKYGVIYIVPLAMVIMISLFITYLIQIILHEAGHFLFGRLTGYRLISFRILNIVIIKDKQGLHIGKYSTTGSLGQCIMLPPLSKDKKPYVLHVVGGIVINAVTAVGALYFALSGYSLPYVIRIILITLSYNGFGLAILNGIPTRQPLVLNDGSCLLKLLKNPLAQKCYFIELSMMPSLMKGKTYKDFAYKMLRVSEGADLSNTIIGNHKILESYYYMDRYEWDKARKCLEAFDPYFEKADSSLKNSIMLEKLFLAIVRGDEKEYINKLYQKLNYLFKKGKEDFSLIRVRTAYKIYMNSNMDKQYTRNDLDKKYKNYANKGEACFCINLIDYMLQHTG